jgi:hypothetical protein
MFKSAAKDYCSHCVDAKGNLLPRKAVQEGIARWFQGWQGRISDQVARQRAGHFMMAMPAWADGAAKKTSMKRKTRATTKRGAPRKARARKSPARKR